NAGPHMADLLLAGSPHFLHVVKHLLDGRAVREAFQDLAYRCIRVGTEKGIPIVLAAHDHHPNHAADHWPSGQKGLAHLEHGLAIENGLDLDPTIAMCSPLGQADFFPAINASSTALP